MAYTVEFVAKLNDQVTAKLKGMSGAVKEFSSNLKAGFVDGVRSALPEQLGFIADKLDALPIAATAAVGGIVAVGSAVVQMATQVASTAIEFDKLSQKTGASVEFLSTFNAVANDAEISTEQVNSALTIFSKRLIDTQGAGANVEATLYALSDQFRSMADGPEKTALAMEYFGRAGANMIPILNQGSAALRENQAAMAEMGRVISGSTVEAANRFDDAMDKLSGRIEGLKNTIGSGVLPALSEIVGGADSAASSISLLGHAFSELTSSGQVSSLTLMNLNKAALDVSIAMSYLNPALAGSRTAFEMQRAATEKAIEGLKNTQSAGVAAAGGFNAAGNAAVGTVPKFNAAGAAALSAAGQVNAGVERLQAAAAYYSKVSADAVQNNLAVISAGMDKQWRLYRANDEKQKAMQAEALIRDRDSNLARAETNTELATSIDAINVGLDKQMGLLAGGGGAAGAATAKIAELNAELKTLEERQQAIGGMLGSNTEAMNAQQKVQTAYALATGQLSQEQFAQTEAIKAVMQGLQDKKVNEEQAVTTAMALAQGYVSAGDAIAVAGESGKRFAEETANVNAIAASAKTKVLELGLAIKEVPDSKNVDVVATILGMSDLREAQTIVEKLDQHERHTITYNVIYRVSQYGAPPPGAPNPGTNPSDFNGGSGASAGGRPTDAAGGSVYAGTAVKVGELGPEVFVPSQNGVIVPNHKTGSGDNITINVYTSDPEAAARAVARKLKRG